MATTIQISTTLAEKLKLRKMYDNESYEDVIWDLIEDSMEISEETKKKIEKGLADVKAGRVYTLAQVKKELNVRN
jgi:predicted transcriptional regulator